MYMKFSETKNVTSNDIVSIPTNCIINTLNIMDASYPFSTSPESMIS
jgi:hypothetical protein